MAKCISNLRFRQCVEDLCLGHSMTYGYVMIESSPPEWQDKIIPGKSKVYLSLTNQGMGDTFITSDRPSTNPIKEQLDHWRVYVISRKSVSLSLKTTILWQKPLIYTEYMPTRKLILTSNMDLK